MLHRSYDYLIVAVLNQDLVLLKILLSQFKNAQDKKNFLNNFIPSQALINEGFDDETAKKEFLTPLKLAIQKNCDEVEEWLTSEGADRNLHDASYDRLIKGILEEDISLLDILLNQFYNLSDKKRFLNGPLPQQMLPSKGFASEEENLTPLQLAIKKRNLQAMGWLIAQGVEITPEDASKCLLMGVLNQDISLLNILLSQFHKASDKKEFLNKLLPQQTLVNWGLASAKENLTPIKLASRRGCSQAVRWLIEQGVEIIAEDAPKYLLLGVLYQDIALLNKLVSYFDNKKEFLDGFLPQQVLVIKRLAIKEEYLTALQLAAKKGYLSVVKWLIDQEVSIDRRHDTYKFSALHYAVLEGHQPVVDFLASIKASTRVVDNKGETPLHLAARTGRIHIKSLLDCDKFSINLTNIKGDTALSLALQSAIPDKQPIDQEMKVQQQMALKRAELLLAKGADPNVTTSRENLPLLHLAIAYLPQGFIETLLEKSANPNAFCHKGTALQYALCVKPNALCVKPNYALCLLKKGADPNLSKESLAHFSPLSIAVFKGDMLAVDTLLTYGANCHKWNGDYTPFLLAAENACRKSSIHPTIDVNEWMSLELTNDEWMRLKPIYVKIAHLLAHKKGEIEQYSPLYQAVINGNLLLVAHLLSYGVGLNNRDYLKWIVTEALKDMKLSLNGEAIDGRSKKMADCLRLLVMFGGNCNLEELHGGQLSLMRALHREIGQENHRYNLRCLPAWQGLPPEVETILFQMFMEAMARKNTLGITQTLKKVKSALFNEKKTPAIPEHLKAVLLHFINVVAPTIQQREPTSMLRKAASTASINFKKF